MDDRLFPVDAVKRCCTCKQVKPLADFNRLKRAKDGRQHSCRECNAAYHYANWDRHMARIRKRKRDRLADNRQRILHYLSDHPCVDCGEQIPSCSSSTTSATSGTTSATSSALATSGPTSSRRSSGAMSCVQTAIDDEQRDALGPTGIALPRRVMVGRLGFGPRSHDLKDRSSTVELAARSCNERSQEQAVTVLPAPLRGRRPGARSGRRGRSAPRRIARRPRGRPPGRPLVAS
jgi:hypothetical protein